MEIKHALITGGAKRIGRVIALYLAKAGWDISLHYCSSASDAEKCAQEIKRIGRNVQIFQADFEDENTVGRLLPKNPDNPITALIHNASLFERDEHDLDGTRHQKVNYDVPLMLSDKLAQQLPENQMGSIVHFLDNTEMPSFLHGYLCSRTKLRAALPVLATRFAPQIRVNALALGPTLQNENESQAHFQSLIDETPLCMSSPLEDVAKATLLLLHTRSITGQIVNVDGGAHLLM